MWFQNQSTHRHKTTFRVTSHAVSGYIWQPYSRTGRQVSRGDEVFIDDGQELNPWFSYSFDVKLKHEPSTMPAGRFSTQLGSTLENQSRIVWSCQSLKRKRFYAAKSINQSQKSGRLRPGMQRKLKGTESRVRQIHPKRYQQSANVDSFIHVTDDPMESEKRWGQSEEIIVNYNSILMLVGEYVRACMRACVCVYFFFFYKNECLSACAPVCVFVVSYHNLEKEMWLPFPGSRILINWG